MKKKIGIITGSGPEAGVDLWQKILSTNKTLLKDEFKGDLDAPNVTIFSVPELGHSMELERNYDHVWETLKATVLDIAKHVDYFVIACNTLNLYASKIADMGYGDQFISTLDVVQEYINQKGLEKICIIGALPVIEMGRYSVFRALKNSFNVEVPGNLEDVHQLIYDVKRLGGADINVINAFDEILDSVATNDVFLACTELPLIQTTYNKKNLIDVTDLLAQSLVRRSLG